YLPRPASAPHARPASARCRQAGELQGQLGGLPRWGAAAVPGADGGDGEALEESGQGGDRAAGLGGVVGELLGRQLEVALGVGEGVADEEDSVVEIDGGALGVPREGEGE